MADEYRRRELAAREVIDENPRDDTPAAPMARRFDPRITLGNLITISLIILGGAVTWGQMVAAAQETSRRLNEMERKEVEIRASYERLNARIYELLADVKTLTTEVQALRRQTDRIERQVDGRKGPQP